VFRIIRAVKDERLDYLLNTTGLAVRCVKDSSGKPTVELISATRTCSG